MKLPRVGWDKMFEDMLYDKISKIYHDLGIDFALTPDFLLMFNRDYKKHISFFKDYFARINQSYGHHHKSKNNDFMSKEKLEVEQNQV